MARINVFIFGLDRAGKTTLVTYFQEKKFIPQSPTIGVNISHLIFAGSNLTMEFTDVGGQKRFRKDWENYLKRPHILVFVIDASDRDEQRIHDGRKELQKLLVNPKVTGIPLLILINKIDLDMVMMGDVVEKKFGLNKIQGREVLVYEVSAKTGKNIDAVVNAMTTLVLKDEGIEYFVNKQVKERSHQLLDRYNKFYTAGIEAYKQSNYDQALASLSLAKEIASNLFQLGIFSGGKSYRRLSSTLAKVERLAEERHKEVMASQQAKGMSEPETLESLSSSLQQDVIPKPTNNALPFQDKEAAMESLPETKLVPPPTEKSQKTQKSQKPQKSSKLKQLKLFLFGTDYDGMRIFKKYLTSEKFKTSGLSYSINVSEIVLSNTNFQFNEFVDGSTEDVRVLDTWNEPDVVVFMVDAVDSTNFPLARRLLLSTLNKSELRGKTVLVVINNYDASDAQPQAFMERIADIKKSKEYNAGIFEVSLRYEYNLEEMFNFLVSKIMKDKLMQDFVSRRLDDLLQNYKQMYKALVKEAKAMEKKKDFQGAFNRVAKAKLIQEELFKNNISKAQKELKKCDDWLSKLRVKSLK